jgi:hypothetical protein
MFCVAAIYAVHINNAGMRFQSIARLGLKANNKISLFVHVKTLITNIQNKRLSTLIIDR